VKKFYSIKLKHPIENMPPGLAEQMLLDESDMVRYLWDNKALEFRYTKGRKRLDLYAEEKHLMVAKLKYPEMFRGKGRMGFIELYIAQQLRKSISLAKGST